MSKIEDFENAPVGATATHPNGSRAMKMDDSELGWIIRTGHYWSDEEMEYWGYTLDAPAPAPATAREALDLAWELAHEVKEGQTIPKGTQVLMLHSSGLKEVTTQTDVVIRPYTAPITRTFDPLPDPEPDWLDAPAVMARLEGWVSCADPQVFTRHDYEAAPSEWLYNGSEKPFRWQDLTDVTPLYPKEGQTHE